MDGKNRGGGQWTYAVPGANVIAGPQGKFPDGTTFTFDHTLVTAGKTPMADDCL